MKNSVTVISHSPGTRHFAAQSANVHFRELSQEEILYAMQKEDACRAARAAQLAKTSGGNPLYIQPGPGSCAF